MNRRRPECDTGSEQTEVVGKRSYSNGPEQRHDTPYGLNLDDTVPTVAVPVLELAFKHRDDDM